MNNYLSIIPPFLTIFFAILTKRVVSSLVIGITTGSFIIANEANTNFFMETLKKFLQVVISDNSVRFENLNIIIFLILLGTIISSMNRSGGIDKLSIYIIQRVKTRLWAELAIIFMGLLIFIDDYFNSLAVGSISQRVADKMKISRAKLAYYLDSTAGPVCIIAPISSWGASIVVLLGSILHEKNISSFTGISLFIQSIPYNYYAILTVVMTILAAIFNLNFFHMKKMEESVPVEEESDSFEKVYLKECFEVLIPIITLFFSTVFLMFLTGHLNSKKESFEIMAALQNSNISFSLIAGGLLSIFSIFIIQLVNSEKRILTKNDLFHGVKLMIPAIVVLLLAWGLANTIRDLETGKYIAEMTKELNISFQFIPLSLFLIAGVMAFSTGTSWATFSMLLPIATDVAQINNIESLPLLVGAVLGGSVFGDHCSPISDTTVLSSVGAGCNHIDHVLSQMPYALIVAFVSGVFYLTT